MNTLTGARRPVLSRRTLMIAVAAIALLLACAKAVYSECCVLVYGMMPPDKITLTAPNGDPITYRTINQAGAETIQKNRQPWVTIGVDPRTGNYVLSDPNGAHAPVMLLPPQRPQPHPMPIRRGDAPSSTH